MSIQTLLPSQYQQRLLPRLQLPQRLLVTPAPAAVAVVKPAPAVVAAPAAPAPVASVANADKEVEQAVQAWAKAWSSKDMNAYLGAYAKNFATPKNQARSAWEEERRARIVGKSRISVKVSDVVTKTNGNTATVKFRQYV